jgi:acyl-CoA thioester hydrolase
VDYLGRNLVFSFCAVWVKFASGDQYASVLAKECNLVTTTPAGFRHQTVIDVRWSDMDALGHVNNAVYLTYLEQARIAYTRELGLRAAPGDDGIGLILARVALDYKQPIVYPDAVKVFTRIIRLGRSSFDSEQIIMRQGNADSAIAAQGILTGVVFDYQARQPIAMPEAWRESILAYEPEPVRTG